MSGGDESSPESTPTADRDWVLAFVRGRDVPCPRCGYNLRDLTDATCPECAEHLSLRVGVTTPRFGWLVAAMAPGLFSGVCAVLMSAPLFIVPVFIVRNTQNYGAPAAAYVAEFFGIVSFLAALWIYRKRRAFLAKSRKAQVTTASVIWGVHIVAFVLLIVGMA